ncbi:hypothetical protein [Engelhardtia mirabilis]|uniref:Uncharacterized protein n=1 Tax=Engelhardtia mirabilis TaxID=2528011 RepID=A0A518BQD2_9BACT|nr:hypothetical protein Pla133_43010 [Planctomycetes bacterium Pla133]QDV03511.1 hypothetical protein Pla86_43000 [Planctomycetes bacterium Pla86]
MRLAKPVGILSIFASVGIAQTTAPSLIVACGTSGVFTYTEEMTIQFTAGSDPVDIASGIFANDIADEWACGVCFSIDPLAIWSCEKGNTGPADPADFTITGITEVGGVFTVTGDYSGGISVECRDC